MKKTLSLIAICLCAAAFSGQAEDLAKIYQQARLTNPDLRSSAADRDAAFEKINASRSPLLPQLGLNVGYNYTQNTKDAQGTSSKATSGVIQLTQTLFNLAQWKALTVQEKTAAVQDIAFRAAEQSLMLNTANAYFNVLSAIDTLSYMEAQKQSIYHQLDQIAQRFSVGLVAVTDVDNARAQYDSVLASEVSARNDLDNKVEVLRQITGRNYPRLASLNIDRFRTESTQPVNALLAQAEANNLNLLSARLTQDLARENIRLAQSGHLPTVNLTASSNLSKTQYDGKNANLPYSGGYQDNTSGSNQVGVTLSMPIFSGGAVASQVKQSQFAWGSASEKLESAHRSMIQTVHSSLNNLNASISSIQAYKQAVVSAESSLKAMQTGYSVGTRTIVDVLNATSTLYDARQKLSNARYSYLINQLNIKYALGTLSEGDLQTMNATLGKEVETSPQRVAPEAGQSPLIRDRTAR